MSLKELNLGSKAHPKSNSKEFNSPKEENLETHKARPRRFNSGEMNDLKNVSQGDRTVTSRSFASK